MFKSLKELMEEDHTYKPNFISDKVSLNEENLTIEIKAEQNYTYEIDLEEITDSASMLDWIF